MKIGQKYTSKLKIFENCTIREIKIIDNEVFIEVIDKDGFNTYPPELFFQSFEPEVETNDNNS